MHKFHVKFQISILIIFISNIVMAQGLSSKHDDIEKAFVYSLNKEVFEPVDYNRYDFFEGWRLHGMLGVILTNTDEIDSLLNYINSREIIDTLSYNEYETLITYKTNKRGVKIPFHPTPGPVAAIIFKHKDNTCDLIWVSHQYIETGHKRRRVTVSFLKWLYDDLNHPIFYR